MPAIAGVLACTAALLTTTPASARSGSEIIERAQTWVDAGVGYQAGGTYTNQYGTYRTDCSGFVSMALGLQTSYVTGTLVDVSFPIAKDALAPGDIINNPASGTAGHVVLFAGWADDAQTRYIGYEESPSGGAHVSEIPYPYWPGYGTFTPRRYIGTTSKTKAPPIVPDAPQPRPARPEPLRDGDFVSNSGEAYRIAGDAAVHVTSWKNLGGRQATRKLTDDDFARLSEQPEDGTFLRTPKPPLGRGETYVVVGGAPMFVPGGTLKPKVKPVTVDQVAIDEAGKGGPLDHLSFNPADGAMVRTDQGDYYVFAGGAPIHVTADWWKSMRPRPTATTVPHLTLALAGGFRAWSHVRKSPADGTLIKANAEVYRITDGVPVAEPGVRGVPVDPQAVANAGQAGPWSHLVAAN